MVERITDILGGLPVIADVAFGCNYTFDGPDYYAEVQHIYWLKKNGDKGKEIPKHMYDRAEKYDPYFVNLTTNISEMLSYEEWQQNNNED